MGHCGGVYIDCYSYMRGGHLILKKTVSLRLVKWRHRVHYFRDLCLLYCTLSKDLQMRFKGIEHAERKAADERFNVLHGYHLEYSTRVERQARGAGNGPKCTPIAVEYSRI